jgi:hypothetical protein
MDRPTHSVTIRVADETLAAIDAREGASRQEKLTGLVERALQIPEGVEALMLSTSQIASLDQTAARWGVSRIEAMQRILSERILREFTQERQRQAFGKGKLASV